MNETVDKAGTYLDVRRERDAAGAKLDDVSRYFSIVSRGLELHQLKLANSDLSVPIDVPDGTMVPYDKWPDKEHVKALLAEYYDLVKKVNAAWAQVPYEHRRDLPSPDAETSRSGSGGQRRVMAS